MVDVGGKETTERVAEAHAEVAAMPETIAAVRAGSIQKGDVLAVARIAGIMAAKRTPDIIPLCHPLPLTSVEVDIRLSETSIDITAIARTMARTGVEMEAMTAAAAAALTIYDMCKSIDRAMVIGDVKLLSKSGGKSGDWRRDAGT